jgi:hypothetical protein
MNCSKVTTKELQELELQNLENAESQAMEWSQNHYPDGSLQHHAAFVNSVTYAVFRFTGRFSGPSIREHVANAAINANEIDGWTEDSIEPLYLFLGPLIHGPIMDQHIRTWIMQKDICFNDDPEDIKVLKEREKDFSLSKETGRYETTRIWPQTLRKLRMIAAMRNESLVEAIDRMANEEFAKLRQTERN